MTIPLRIRAAWRALFAPALVDSPVYAEPIIDDGADDTFLRAACGDADAQCQMVQRCLSLGMASGDYGGGLAMAEVFSRMALAQGHRTARYQHVSLLALIAGEAELRDDADTMAAVEVESIALLSAIADEQGFTGEVAAENLQHFVGMATPEVVEAAKEYRKACFA